MGGLDRGRNRGMVGQSQRVELRKPGKQQGFQVSIARAQRPRHPLVQGPTVAATLAQRRQADRLQQGTVTAVVELLLGRAQYCLQRAAIGADILQHAGCPDPHFGARHRRLCRPPRANPVWRLAGCPATGVAGPFVQAHAPTCRSRRALR